MHSLIIIEAVYFEAVSIFYILDLYNKLLDRIRNIRSFMKYQYLKLKSKIIE